MNPVTCASLSLRSGLGCISGKSAKRSGEVSSGTLKSMGGRSFGSWSWSAFGLLFCALERCVPVKDKHRSNPDKSLAPLWYPAHFVTFRAKPRRLGSLSELIQEYRNRCCVLMGDTAPHTCAVLSEIRRCSRDTNALSMNSAQK